MSSRSSTSSRPSLNVLEGFRRAWQSTSEDKLPYQEPKENRFPEALSKRDNWQHRSHTGRPLRAPPRLSSSQEDVEPDFRFRLTQHEGRNRRWNEYHPKDSQQPREQCESSKFQGYERKNSNTRLGNQRTLERERQNDAEIFNGTNTRNSDDEDCRYMQTKNKSEAQFRDIIEEDIHRTLQTERWHRDGRTRGQRRTEENLPKESYSRLHKHPKAFAPEPNRKDQPIYPSKRERNPNSHARFSNDVSAEGIITSAANERIYGKQNFQDEKLKSTKTASIQASKQADQNRQNQSNAFQECSMQVYPV